MKKVIIISIMLIYGCGSNNNKERIVWMSNSLDKPLWSITVLGNDTIIQGDKDAAIKNLMNHHWITP